MHKAKAMVYVLEYNCHVLMRYYQWVKSIMNVGTRDKFYEPDLYHGFWQLIGGVLIMLPFISLFGIIFLLPLSNRQQWLALIAVCLFMIGYPIHYVFKRSANR